METALTGKTILILGGSSGIGFGVAQALVRENANIVIGSSSQAKVDKKIAQLKTENPNYKGTLTGYAIDLRGSEMESRIKKLFDDIVATGATLDHVIHTAGDPLKHTPLSSLGYAELIERGDVRFHSAVFVAKYAAIHLPKSNVSSITFTTGTASVKPIPTWGVASSYGAALQGLTRGLAVDLKPIRVNLACPGAILTELWDGMRPEQRDGFLAQVKEKSLTGAIGTVEDTAETYLYALKCKFLTGEMLKVDGGGVLT